LQAAQRRHHRNRESETDGQASTLGRGAELYTGDTALLKVLQGLGVTPEELARVSYAVAPPPPAWIGWLTTFLPVVLFAAVMLFLWRRSASRSGDGGNNSLLAFGRSRARVVQAPAATITFSDVAGVDEARLELQEIVEFLREPDRFVALGARIPHGPLAGRPAPARPCWRAQSRARPGCRFSTSRVPNSSKCSSASAPAAYATCSPMRARARRASCSSTRSMPSDASAARDWATPMTSANRR
jgi:hypothetical protein